MPTYQYECENCGPFSDSYPMSAFDKPQPCPDCSEPSPRLLTLPAIGGMAREDTGGATAPAHAGGCACCAGPRTWSAEAV